MCMMFYLNAFRSPLTKASDTTWITSLSILSWWRDAGERFGQTPFRFYLANDVLVIGSRQKVLWKEHTASQLMDKMPDSGDDDVYV